MYKRQPDEYSEEQWRYGFSLVHFFKGRVDNWESGNPPLRAFGDPPGPSFFLGSTHQDVIRAMGDPDRQTDAQFWYGSSVVMFREGRVTDWIIGNRPIRAFRKRPDR